MDELDREILDFAAEGDQASAEGAPQEGGEQRLDDIDHEILGFAQEGEQQTPSVPASQPDAFEDEEIASFARGDEAPERTAAGRAKAFGQGVPQGLLGAAGGALRGADRAISSPEDLGEGRLAETGQALIDRAEDIDIDPMYEADPATDLGRGVGSMAMFLPLGGGGGAAARGLSRVAGAGQRGQRWATTGGQYGATVPTAAAAGADEAFERAKAHGLDDEEAQSVARQFGLGGGAVQVANIGFLLRSMPQEARRKLFDRAGGQIVSSMANEAGVEGAGALVQNWGQMSYDEQQELFDDVLYRAGIGAGSAGITQAGRAAVERGRGLWEGDPTDFERELDSVVESDPELQRARDGLSKLGPDEAADTILDLMEVTQATDPTPDQAGQRIEAEQPEGIAAQTPEAESAPDIEVDRMTREHLADPEAQPESMPADPAEGDEVRRTDGTAYPTETAARLAARGRRLEGYEPAQAADGWVLRRPDAAMPAEAPAAEAPGEPEAMGAPDVADPAAAPVEAADVDAPGVEEGPAQETAPADQGVTDGLPVQEVPVERLRLSDEVPQFKAGADEDTGVVDPLGGEFDRRGVAPIQIWERSDGSQEVVTGRHRLDLARRSGEETIPAQIHREDEGFTAEDARALDAILNIRDGQGEVKDYVQFFRSHNIPREQADQEGLTARAKGRRGFEIAERGSDVLAEAHAADQVTDEAAAQIANAAPGDDSLQALGLAELRDGRSIQQAANTIRAVQSMGERADPQQGDMFGLDESAMERARDMSRVASRRQSEIGRRLSAIRGAARRPDVARSEGVDVSDPEAVNQRIEQLQQERERWANWQTDPELVAEIRRELGDDVAPEPGVDPVAEPTTEEAEAGQEDLLGPVDQQAQQRADAERTVDDRLAGRDRDAVDPGEGPGGLFDGSQAQMDVEDVAGRPGVAREGRTADRGEAPETEAAQPAADPQRTISADKRGRYTAPLGRLLRGEGVRPQKVQRQNYADDGAVTVVRLDEQLDPDDRRRQAGIAHELLSEIAPQISDSNAVVMRSDQGVLAVYEGGRGFAEQSGLQQEVRRPEFVEGAGSGADAGRPMFARERTTGPATRPDRGDDSRFFTQRDDGSVVFNEEAYFEYENNNLDAIEAMEDEGGWTEQIRLKIPDADYQALADALGRQIYYHSGMASQEGVVPTANDEQPAYFSASREYAETMGRTEAAPYRITPSSPLIVKSDDALAGSDSVIARELREAGYDAAITPTGEEVVVIDQDIVRHDTDADPSRTEAGKAQGRIDQAAAETDTDPTEAQAEAGNYRKGRLSLHGLDISIENPRGSTRSGTAPDGTSWETTMADHYGYIRRSEGADGDHVDVFLGEQAHDPDLPVFVVDQVDPESGAFDEHKVMLGYPDEQAARDGYLANYEDGWQGLGGIRELSLDDFKAWLESGDTTTPAERAEAPRHSLETREGRGDPIVSGQGEDLVTLYHGTDQEGADAIRASGDIKSGGPYMGVRGVSLTPRRDVAQEFADANDPDAEGVVFEVEVPRDRLQIDPEHADTFDLQAALDDGASVIADNDVVVDEEVFRSAQTEGSRHAFGGERAETADHHSLADAVRRLEAGENAETVRRETGWHRGPDERWRFEIDDSQASVNLEALERFEGGWQRQARLGDLLDHPQLFAAYPGLADMDVATSRSRDSSYSPAVDMISLSDDLRRKIDSYAEDGDAFKFLRERIEKLENQDVEAEGRENFELSKQVDNPYGSPYATVEDAIKHQRRFRDLELSRLRAQLESGEVAGQQGIERRILSTILHEVQHAIQVREGFAEGGNSDQAPRQISRQIGREMADTGAYQALREHASAIHEMGVWTQAETISDLRNVKQPRQVLRSEVYQENKSAAHDHAGEPPKRGRLQWAQDVGAFLAGQMQREAGPDVRSILEQYSRNEIKNRARNARRRLSRQDTKRLQRANLLDQERKRLEQGVSRSEAERLYRALYGEVEARNVQHRQHMSADERAETAPEQTQDVGDADAIVVFRGTEHRAPAHLAESPSQMSASEGQAHVDQVTANWADAPAIRVVETGLDLPAAVARQAFEEGALADVRGVYHQGEVYLVASRHRTIQDLERTLLHESIGHYGLRRMLGQELNPLLNQVWASYGRTGLQDVIDTYFPQGDFNPDNREHRHLVAEEKLARMAEMGDRLGERQGIVRRFIQAVRNWARRAGMRVNLTDSELAEILQRARQAVEQGGMDMAPRQPSRMSVIRYAMPERRQIGRGQTTDPAEPQFDDMPAIENRYAELARLRGFWEGAADVLRRQPQLRHLADAIDGYFDASRRRLGEVNSIIRPAMQQVPSRLNRRAYRETFRLFERYQAAKENGRKEEARQIREEGPEAVRGLIHAWEKVARLTGDQNREVGVKVWDDNMIDWNAVRERVGPAGERQLRGVPRKQQPAKWAELVRRQNPQSELLHSHPDLPRKGGWRDIGQARDFFPRVLKKEVQQALMHPKGQPETWARIQEELLAAGYIQHPREAERYINNHFARERGSDYFAGIEKARKEPLPEWFYDYSWDAAMIYKDRWADRISQVEFFGQAEVDPEGDIFDKAKKLTTDHHTQGYIDQVQQRVYNNIDTSMLTQFMGVTNTFATGAMLGNPATAVLNLIGGSGLNFQLYGAWPGIKALAHEVSRFGQTLDMGTQKGILVHDFLTVLHDAQQQGVPERLSKFTSTMLKLGGYTPAEVFIRSHAMLTAKAFLDQSLALWNRNPSSKRSLRHIAFFQREGFDYRRLLEENGEGPETDRFLRKGVNLTQGSYRVNQVPVFTDTPAGRFLFKYQKFGTQLSRMFWRHHLKPAIDSLFQGGEIVDVEIGGEMHQKRVRTITPLIRFFMVGAVGGSILAMIREGAFGYQDPGPEWEEIEKQLASGEWAEAAVLGAWRFWHSNMAVGSLGFFGNYAQFFHDVADRQRVKSPLDPPGLSPVTETVDMGMRFFEQGGYLDWRDAHDFLEGVSSQYRTGNRAALIALNQVTDWRQAEWESVQRDRSYVRKMVRRYADEANIERRRRAPDRIAHSEMTPITRRINKELLLGNAEAAREIAVERLEQAETRNDFDRTMRAIQASVRAYQPARVIESPSDAERRDFLRWVEGRVGPEAYQRIRQTDERFREAAQQAGLMPEDDPLQEMRQDWEHERGDEPMGEGERRLRMMRQGLLRPQ
ncbi:LPD23 domain-containing protein [Halorhodospira halophila]|uniref:LPD23 domain-containing protein n=1 Tax=Halorhodospira halophila TaxID=1053 RepID=UPI0019142114|nr:LPD23 domain-containing protein [Halorhodospira halophila]MBK5942696.1 hypothetical protein [Halorhodospira halophila]